jgi:hypothetical protein
MIKLGVRRTFNLGLVKFIVVLITAFTPFVQCVFADTSQEEINQDTIELEQIQDLLTERYKNLVDISFLGKVTRFVPETQEVLQNASFRLRAVLPNQVRVTFISPEIYSGVEYLLDQKLEQVIIHMPITEMAQCQSVESFLQSYSIAVGSVNVFNPSSLFASPEGEKFYEMELVEVAANGSKRNAVIEIRPLPDGIEAVEDVVEDVLGEKLKEWDTDLTELVNSVIIRVWVDLDLAMITRIEELDEEYRVNYTLDIQEVEFNTGLQGDILMKLPKGTIKEGCK